MTDGPLRIGVVLSARPWATQFHAHATDNATDIEVVVVRDHRAALESQLHLLVADETTPWLTQPFIRRCPTGRYERRRRVGSRRACG